MSSREFLNAAHALLVEESMRSRTIKGITIQGLSLEEALDAAAMWSEGYRPDADHLVTDEPRQEEAIREAAVRSEEEIVAQNQRAMQAFESRLAGMKGGFRPVNV